MQQIAYRLNVAGYPADADREMWAAFCDNIVFFPRDVVLVQASLTSCASRQACLHWTRDKVSQINMTTSFWMLLVSVPSLCDACAVSNTYR